SRCRPQPDRHVGSFARWQHHPPGARNRSTHQNGCDLGGRHGHLPGPARKLASAAGQWTAAVHDSKLAAGLGRPLWKAGTESAVLGFDLADVVPGGHHGADPGPSWDGRCRGAAGLLPETHAAIARGRQVRRAIYVSRRRPQHRAGVLIGDGALDRLLRPRPEGLAVCRSGRGGLPPELGDGGEILLTVIARGALEQLASGLAKRRVDADLLVDLERKVEIFDHVGEPEHDWIVASLEIAG